MRKALQKLGEHERHTFTAEFVRFGIKNGWKGDVPTVLFKDVKLGEKEVCDHLWFTCGKQFDSLGLQAGDRVEFSARVASYVKGYMGHRDDVWDKEVEEDWKLSFPTKVRKIGRNECPDTPLPPRHRDCEGFETTSLESHSNRVERALRNMRLEPPKFHAVFIDAKGEEMASVDSEEDICKQIGITYDQWKCFFRGLVGTPGKGAEVSLQFRRRRNGDEPQPYFQYGIINEKKKRYGDWCFAGYGFLMANYLLGWKEYKPLYIAGHKEELDGKETERGRVHFVRLGDLQKWDMSVVGNDHWKDAYELRLEKINRTQEEVQKGNVEESCQ